MQRVPESDSRRRLLKAGGILLLGTTTPALTACGSSRRHLSGVDDAMRAIDFYAGRSDVACSGAWTPAQVFAHCAQSIEYSLAGFPQLKSGLFRATVGPAAAGLFAALGRMRHNLAEPIPGAPALAQDLALATAADRLRAAFVRFQGDRGLLHPHFAYGELAREDYLSAHVLHLDNHLDQFTPRPDFLQLPG